MKRFSKLSYFRYYKIVFLAIFTVIAGFPSSLHAQGDGPRFYWKTLAGMYAIPVIGSSMSGNANPLDPSHQIVPDADFQATMAMPGFARVIPLFKRSAMVSVIAPMGRITSNLSVVGIESTQTARGFGDPLLQLGVNIIGPKAIMNIPDMLRYKPGFSVDIIGSLAIPIGEYDNESPVNIGQNRWYGRVGLPIVWQLGSWVPGKKTTLEALPAIWLFGDNTDFMGKKMETKPMYQIEGHLTRDFMARMWGSLDFVWYSGGEATIDGIDGEQMNNSGIGGTLGYHVNDNMQLTIAYVSSINDKADDDLKMDTFRVTLIYGWHKLIEGMHRLKGGE